MMVIACGDSSIQTTYDESQGDIPSPAPIESVGQITIVKITEKRIEQRILMKKKDVTLE